MEDATEEATQQGWKDGSWKSPVCVTTLHGGDSKKKVLREMQTLRAGCSKVQPKIFAPPHTPSQGRGTAKV